MVRSWPFVITQKIREFYEKRKPRLTASRPESFSQVPILTATLIQQLLLIRITRPVDFLIPSLIDNNNENDRALKQRDLRSLTWSKVSNGNTMIQLVLPPEIAQAFLNSVEHCLNQLDSTDSKMAQRRADHPYGYKAAVLMAETSLQSAGKTIATADRYQVIVSVDAAELTLDHESQKGGYTIEHVDHLYGQRNDDQRLDEQFVQQQHTNNNSLFDFESALRNSRASFNAVRKLSPTQYRFRVVDAQGKNILDQSFANTADTKHRPTRSSHHSNLPCESTRDSTRTSKRESTREYTRESTPILCSESIPNSYYSGNNNCNAKLFTGEVLSNYTLTANLSTTLR